MSFSDVTSATNYFSQANEGFTTTTSGTVASGATSVGLSSVSGLINGSVFVGVIEPGEAKEQVFSGLVDTGGSQITSVVWTKGTNTDHSAGVAVVDYDTGTHHNLTSAGILKEHSKTGVHTNITGTTANFTGAVSTDTVSEHTVATGVTIDGVKLKDGTLQTADAVADSALIYGKLRSRQGGSASDWQSQGTTTYDYSATNTFIQVGMKQVTNTAGADLAVTFPTAFTNKPIVILTANTTTSANQTALANAVTTTGFNIRTVNAGGGTDNIAWLAIGE